MSHQEISSQVTIRNEVGTLRETGKGLFPLSPEEIGYLQGIDQAFCDNEERLGYTENDIRPPDCPEWVYSRLDYRIGEARGYKDALHVLATVAIASGLRGLIKGEDDV